MAETFPVVIGSPKKIIPLAATGNLFNAPTILYVVLEVTLTHQADAYEILNADIPENNMAVMSVVRISLGLRKKV